MSAMKPVKDEENISTEKLFFSAYAYVNVQTSEETLRISHEDLEKQQKWRFSACRIYSWAKQLKASASVLKLSQVNLNSEPSFL